MVPDQCRKYEPIKKKYWSIIWPTLSSGYLGVFNFPGQLMYYTKRLDYVNVHKCSHYNNTINKGHMSLRQKQVLIATI